jgi:hypothetical protein
MKNRNKYNMLDTDNYIPKINTSPKLKKGSNAPHLYNITYHSP